MLLDADGGLVAVNEAAEALFGQGLGLLARGRFSAALPPGSALVSLLNRAIEEGYAKVRERRRAQMAPPASACLRSRRTVLQRLAGRRLGAAMTHTAEVPGAGRRTQPGAEVSALLARQWALAGCWRTRSSEPAGRQPRLPPSC